MLLLQFGASFIIEEKICLITSKNLFSFLFWEHQQQQQIQLHLLLLCNRANNRLLKDHELEERKQWDLISYFIFSLHSLLFPISNSSPKSSLKARLLVPRGHAPRASFLRDRQIDQLALAGIIETPRPG